MRGSGEKPDQEKEKKSTRRGNDLGRPHKALKNCER
ncbi:hypothetical protein SAMN06265337_1343 [Hymenobacter gelipurpurascens]|uniref:Uncharacterized protein n=1 Tax=Hymenobacter gelipurpurascens TaxID=89968 RepID=A0A212TI50_9BACT|nr:hypothetical protein SAMN06265337_1343 [Hymenobacter gelipurpurascens]